MNRYYQAGIRIGAATLATWSVSQYQAMARKLWVAMPTATPFAVFAITKDGDKFVANPFTAKRDAADKYGALADRPGSAIYLAFFDRTVLAGEDELIEEAFFQPTEIVHTVTVPAAPIAVTTRTPLAVKAGLGLAAGLGLLALIAKH